MANETDPGKSKALQDGVHSALQLAEAASRSLNRSCRPLVRYWQRLGRYGPWKAIVTPPDRTIFARAVPERLSLMERYAYEQEISHNPQPGAYIPPTGTVKVRVPYD